MRLGACEAKRNKQNLLVGNALHDSFGTQGRPRRQASRYKDIAL